MNNLLAQSTPLGNIDIEGPLGNFTKTGSVVGSNIFTIFSGFLSNMIALLTVVAGIWFLYQIILSGIQWLGAGGDKAVIETTKKRLSYAFAGLVLVVASYILIGLIGNFFGLDIYNIELLIARIHP